MDKLGIIQCDLLDYKITLQIHGQKTPLVIHFDTPSRKFYFSLISLLITEMKKQEAPGFVHIHRHQDILTLLDKTLSGKNASKNVDGMWAKINMAWRHRLPDLESASLFKVIDRELIPPYEKGGKYRYQCSEIECDIWASLFSYDDTNKWRLRFASDSDYVDFNDISVTLGDFRDKSAWDEYINRLTVEAEADNDITESADEGRAILSPKKKIGQRSPRNTFWGLAAIVVTVVIAVMGWQYFFHNKHRPSDTIDLGVDIYPPKNKPSLAVLPFDNLTGDPKQAYLGEGISDHLITSLSQGPYLYVTARTSSFAFKGKSIQAQEIASRLGVNYLIEGSVQRDNDQLRINVQLIEGRNGNHIWSQSYDRSFSELFDIQDEINMAVMSFLNVKITGYSSGALKYSRPNSLKAYEYYLKGLYYSFGRKRENVQTAQEAFEKAIRIDPNFGRAYAWLANTHMDKFILRLTGDREQVLNTAEKYINKAFSIDPTYPPYGAMSRHSRLKKDMEKSILYGYKYVQQSPNDPFRHYRLAVSLYMGERYDETVDSCETALRLSPFRPVTYIMQLGWAFVGNAQYDKSIPLFEEVIERSPDSFYAYLCHKGLTAAYELTGQHAKAKQAAQNVMRINPKFTLESEYKVSQKKKSQNKDRIFDAYRRAGLK